VDFFSKTSKCDFTFIRERRDYSNCFELVPLIGFFSSSSAN
jgi:hypothetical protein